MTVYYFISSITTHKIILVNNQYKNDSSKIWITFQVTLMSQSIIESWQTLNIFDFFFRKKLILTRISEKNDSALPNRPIRWCLAFIPFQKEAINFNKKQSGNMIETWKIITIAFIYR